MRTLIILQTIVIGLLMGPIGTASAASQVTGTATFRERMALPPDAVFEATLLDTSRADAAAVEIGRTTINNPGTPPITFAIDYDPAKIDPKMTYVVRTRVTVGERLLFTSDTVQPVLTRGAPSEVSVMMRMVGAKDTPPAAAAANDQAAANGDTRLINGMFVYFADAGKLLECRSDHTYPVAMEGDFRRLERAYLDTRRAPGQPLMVTIEGSIVERPRMEGEGTEAMVVPKRFVHIWPGELCERNRADASLTNTYWRIVKLGGETVHVVQGRKEPQLTLREQSRFSATVGCNQMAGGYETTGNDLQFKGAISTMMACPPPLDQLERKLADLLDNTKRWQIAGQFLELSDADGKPLALLQAVYLK